MVRSHLNESKSKSQSVPRQASISSFFGPKRIEGISNNVSARPPIIQKKLKHVRSSLTDSGSFDDCEPDDELKRLMDVPELNNFKPCRDTSILHSETSLQKSFYGRVGLCEANNRPLGIKLPSSSSKVVKNRKSPRKVVSKLLNSFDKCAPIVLTEEQERVINLVVNERKNVFYTGSAGTGKSVILRTLIDRLSSLHGRRSIAVTASTGLAAATIGGITFHRWCGIGLGNQSVDHMLKRIKKQRQLLATWKFTKVLIVDEISMLDGRILDKVEKMARYILQNDKPFGGIQLVLTGDFFQLPPVTNNNTMFGFESQMWEKCIERTILLTKVFRQKDNTLIEILNTIRYGELTPESMGHISSLRREVRYFDGIVPTELYATRKEVELSNARQLSILPGEAKVFKSLDVGPPELLSLLDTVSRADKVVTLKIDAQVMMLRNKPESELVNGTLGKVLFFTTERLEKSMKQFYQTIDDELIRDMRLVSEAISNYSVFQKEEFRCAFLSRPKSRQGPLQSLLAQATSALAGQEPIYPYVRYTVGPGKYYCELTMPEPFIIDVPSENTTLERTQLPITLCWALSIHKAQGQTIQRLKVDLRNIFEAGQVYVALSRAVSVDNLQVLNFDPKKIRANSKVRNFYKNLETLI